MAIFRGPNMVTDGLVLTLDASNSRSYPGTGNVIYDLSGNDNIIIYGTTTISNGIIDLGTVGNITNYLKLPNSCMSNLNIFSVSIWFNVNNLTRLNSLFHATNSGGNDFAIELYPTYIQTLMGSTYSSFTFAFINNIWYNIVFVRVGSLMYFYKNGILFGSVACPSYILNITGAIILGQEQDALGGGFDSTQNFNGKYGPIFIYNRELTSSEILQNYDSQKSRFGL